MPRLDRSQAGPLGSGYIYDDPWDPSLDEPHWSPERCDLCWRRLHPGEDWRGWSFSATEGDRNAQGQQLERGICPQCQATLDEDEP